MWTSYWQSQIFIISQLDLFYPFRLGHLQVILYKALMIHDTFSKPQIRCHNSESSVCLGTIPLEYPLWAEQRLCTLTLNWNTLCRRSQRLSSSLPGPSSHPLSSLRSAGQALPSLRSLTGFYSLSEIMFDFTC